MGSGSKLGKIGKKIAKHDPLRGGDKILEAIGLPTFTGEGENNILDMGEAAAMKAAEDQAASQAEQNRLALEAAEKQRQAAADQAQAIREQTNQQVASSNQQNQLMMDSQNLQAQQAAQQAALMAARNQAYTSVADQQAEAAAPSVRTKKTSTVEARRKYSSLKSSTGTTSTGVRI